MSTSEESSLMNLQVDESSETDWKQLAIALLAVNSLSLEMADDYRNLRGILDEIVEAYRMKGLFPGYRAYAVTGLEKEWPELWKALEKACEYQQQATHNQVNPGGK